MPEKWVPGGLDPEGTVRFKKIKVRKPRKVKGLPEPPPNFTPDELGRTTDEEHPPIISFVQGVSQALEKKEEERLNFPADEFGKIVRKKKKPRSF